MVESLLYYAGVAAGAAFQLISAAHALLNKRDPRSQLGWLVLCVMLPVVGAAAYWLLGVNRIRTRARRRHERGRFADLSSARSTQIGVDSLAADHPARAESMRALLQISERVTERPLVGGNLVEPLYCGEQAFPAMIEAIDAARSHVHLCTYIFQADPVGRDFVAALGRAARRGVDVRVMVDAVGERYGRRRISRVLRREHPDVRVERFLSFGLSLRAVRINLRNHRKLLVVDGQVGFTGGMNIALRHMVNSPANRARTADVHFRVRGPVVFAMEETFMEDWFFETGDAEWPAAENIASAGRALCRPIKDGPNQDFERLQWILVGAMSCAHQSIRIMTPYFIPGRELLAAINAAALRGVNVEIILPLASNLPYVDWACRALLGEVVQYGAAVYLQPAPFNHAKLFIVDDFYVNLGSANLDPRSLQLNFEFNLEVYDLDLAGELGRYFEEVRGRSTPIGVGDLDRRSLPVKLRDAMAKLFSPYL